MLTLALEDKFLGWDLLSAVPEKIRHILLRQDLSDVMEIRLRQGVSLSLVKPDGVFYVTKEGSLTKNYQEGIYVSQSDIKRGMELITRSSVYAYENEIKNGYITLSGGHRVGISGDAVTDSGRLSHLKTIQSMNYRFAKEIIGCASEVMPYITKADEIKNTILVSPPCCGKTTMLRDIARSLSVLGKKVSIVDERGEIAAIYDGCSPFDLGANCDVLSGVDKADGMLLMLRAMSPDVIITDEIGDERDFMAIAEIKKRGVKVITTLHGNNENVSDFDLLVRLGGVGKCLSFVEAD